MTRVVLTDEAQAEVLQAFSFYENRREGLGERFRDHLDNAMAKIRGNPVRYPLFYKDLRRRLVERFPYAIFYRVYPGVVVVVALMHGKQNPARLRRRAGQQGPV